MNSREQTERFGEAFRRTLGGAAVAAALLAGGGAAAQQEWRLNEVVAETRPGAQVMAAFAERVNQRAVGKLVVTPYYANSLGIAQEDLLRAISTDAIEMSSLYAGYLSRDAPDLAMAIVQGVIVDPEENVEVFPTLRDIYAEYIEKEWGIVVVGWVLDSSFDIGVYCDQPVNTLEELRAHKLRVWAQDQVDTFAKLGVAAQIVPQNDLYVALQTGVIDCALYAASIVKTISLQEVVDYGAYLHTYTNLPSAIVVSPKAWASIPDDVQRIILEEAETAFQDSLVLARDRDAEQAAIAELESEGSVDYLEPFPEADRALFYQTVTEVWAESAAEVGGKAPSYREQVMRALEQARSQ